MFSFHYCEKKHYVKPKSLKNCEMTPLKKQVLSYPAHPVTVIVY